MGDTRRDAAEGGGGGIGGNGGIGGIGGIGGNFGSTLGSTKGAFGGAIPRTPLMDSNGGRLALGGLRKLGKAPLLPPTLTKSSSAAAALQGGGTALRRPIELARLASEGRLGNNIN